MTEALRIPISLVPVVAFLIGLRFMDSFKLVTARSLVRTLVAGVIAAGICLIMNRDLLLGLLELLVDVALALVQGRASVACYGGGLAVHRIGSTDPGTDRV